MSHSGGGKPTGGEVAADLQDEAQREPPASEGVLDEEAESKETPQPWRRGRHPMPAHLERQKIVLEPENLAPCALCGQPLICLGQETSEELE